jgi:hypothetical protein
LIYVNSIFVGGIFMPEDFNIGDTIELKKQHPCGSSGWEILRVGADLRIKCLGCGHQVMIARAKLEKSLKKSKKSNP